MPIQHCAPAILEAMGRSSASPERVIDMIRLAIPEVSLRTSIMVGFPGESRSDFKSLVEFIRRVEFDHLGVFVYSPEAGAKAARFPGRPSVRTAESRRAALLEVQREVSARKLKSLVGRTVPVLIEGPHPETDLLLSGRMNTQAPDVDGTVIITAGFAESGQIRPVRVTVSHDYDLEAVIL
jgi:ribosomal protein S12 methylthiotransferase